MKDIYTVILFNEASGDLSTVSFNKYKDAQEYVAQEVLESDDGSINIDDVLNALDSDMFYDDGNTKYYIEEAKLID